MTPPPLSERIDDDPPYIYRSWRTVCAVSFLMYASLGSVLATLPLFLHDSLKLSWMHTGWVFAAIPLGSMFSIRILRRARQAQYDARLGAALGQMTAAAIAMFVAWAGQSGHWAGCDWRIAIVLVASYGVLVPLTQGWLQDFAASTAPTNPNASREWRLWGAVGFMLPAWATEFIAARFATAEWGRFETLFVMSGWTGIAAAILLLVARTQETTVPIVEAPTATAPVPAPHEPGTGVVLALLLIGALLRCHDLWMSPYIDAVLLQHSITVPLTFRLAVVSHVVEVATLYVLGQFLLRLGVRLTLLLSVAGWMARCLLLSWIAQMPLSPKEALSYLFLAQFIGGVSTILFFGPIAVLLGRDIGSSKQGLGAAVSWVALVAALAVVMAGIAASGTLDPQPTLAQMLLNKLPEELVLRETAIPLRGWAGLWMMSSLLPLLAFPLVLFATTRRNADKSQSAAGY